MSYLLDTNVVSEWTTPRPDSNVVRWLRAVDEDAVFLSVITLAEIRHGVERLSAGKRRRRLDEWLTAELPARFFGRILDIDSPTADVWGRLMATAEQAGRRVSAMDGFIAATALVHSLTLVTRNVRDFDPLAVEIVDPWEPRSQ